MGKSKSALAAAAPGIVEEGDLVQRMYDIQVEATPDVAFEQFKEVVWKGLGFQSLPLLGMLPPAKIVKKGEKDGKGQIRAVPGAWMPLMQEEILGVKENEQIVYTVKKGPFPASYHRGQVDFEDLGDGRTRIVWSVKMKPYTGCFGVTKFLVYFMFPTGLKSVKNKIDELNKEN